jgi:hypothetical protein
MFHLEPSTRSIEEIKLTFYQFRVLFLALTYYGVVCLRRFRGSVVFNSINYFLWFIRTNRGINYFDSRTPKQFRSFPCLEFIRRKPVFKKQSISPVDLLRC